jgi:hypothetical protein
MRQKQQNLRDIGLSDDYPDNLLDPIAAEPLFDAYTASDGYSYNKNTIEQLYNNRNPQQQFQSPITRQPMSLNMNPNATLRQQTFDFAERHGIVPLQYLDRYPLDRLEYYKNKLSKSRYTTDLAYETPLIHVPDDFFLRNINIEQFQAIYSDFLLFAGWFQSELMYLWKHQTNVPGATKMANFCNEKLRQRFGYSNELHSFLEQRIGQSPVLVRALVREFRIPQSFCSHKTGECGVNFILPTIEEIVMAIVHVLPSHLLLSILSHTGVVNVDDWMRQYEENKRMMREREPPTRKRIKREDDDENESKENNFGNGSGVVFKNIES